MKRNTKQTLAIFLVGAGLSITGCQKSKSKAADDDDDDSTTVATTGGGAAPAAGSSQTVPQVGAISLAGLGQTDQAAAALALTDEETCKQENLGVMGMALGGACHTAPLAARVMLGKSDGDFDGDGDMDCDDLISAKAQGLDPGLMLHLLCEDVMLKHNNVISLAFADDKNSFAVAFTDFPNETTAAGSWTQGNAASYPADIRIYRGTTLSDLAGGVALSLTDVNNGSIYLDGKHAGGADFQTALTFSNKASTAGCVDTPSSDNCHTQEIKIFAGTGDVTFGPPNGFHLKIYADDKKAPTFIALEGRYTYSAATAAHFVSGAGALTCPGSEIGKVRSIYFQTVQKGEQVWGHFAFRDENDALLTCTMLGGVDPFAILATEAGVCQNKGSSEWVACTDVTAADYATLWTGEADFAAVTASPIGDIWKGAPTVKGVCTTTGCTGAQ